MSKEKIRLRLEVTEEQLNSWNNPFREVEKLLIEHGFDLDAEIAGVKDDVTHKTVFTQIKDG